MKHDQNEDGGLYEKCDNSSSVINGDTSDISSIAAIVHPYIMNNIQ